MSTKTIVIGTDFSDTPGGRYFDDGPFSGQRFREEFLIPALKSNDKVVVDISGVEGYGSSFLEEVFGGLVRSNVFTKEEIGVKLTCVASDASNSCYLDRISAYMDEARGRSK